MEIGWTEYKGYSIYVHPMDGFTVYADRVQPMGRIRFIGCDFKTAVSLIENGAYDGR